MAVAELPGFQESLRLLIEREQYTLTDVGFMFGISRERVRQLTVKYHIQQGPKGPRGLRAYRVWDDTEHRFYPVTRQSIIQARRQRARVARRERCALARQRRRVLLMLTLYRLRQQLEREPKWWELEHALFGSATRSACIRVLNWWDGGLRVSTQIRMRLFKQVTGYVSYPRGRHPRSAVIDVTVSPIQREYETVLRDRCLA